MQPFDLTDLAKRLMIEKGFIPDYPTQIIAQTQNIHLTEPKNVSTIADMRQKLWFSIDNDDSRDLDQLTYAEKQKDGYFKIWIAVANVSYLVKKESAIDDRAAQNTTTVYTPTKIFPMLPEKLSTDLTSLNPNVDRLALVFEGVISDKGNLVGSSIFLAKVHNYAKLTYNAIGQWLEGLASEPSIVTTTAGLKEQVLLQDAIATKLGAYRQTYGALSLETIEANPIFLNGRPIAIQKVEKNRARNLIENFMIIANTISAQFSQARGIPSIRRVVTEPKYWDRIVEVASEEGYKLPSQPSCQALEQFLLKQKQQNPLTFPDLSLTIIKLLGKGEYMLALPNQSAPGHFGLALRDYSHSTAPNRRFVDLITQRLLISTLNQTSLPYTNEQLMDLAAHCTQKEDDAEKIERHMRKSAAAMILENSIGQEYDAIVTGSSGKGTWVRTFNPPIEGKLVRGGNHNPVGTRLKVRLIHTDVEQGFIDFERI